MSEPGGVKDFAYRVVGLKVTLCQRRRGRCTRGSARPRVPGFYRAIRMMRVATVKRVLATLPQKLTSSLSRELEALGT